MKKTFLSIILFFLILSIATSCRQSERYSQLSGMIWNTEYHITYRSDNEALADSVYRVLDEVTRSLSVFDTTSLVARVNALDSAKVDSHFINVYNASLKINRISGKRFDPTISPLITAWGFGPGHKASSDTIRIDSILRFVGIEKTRLDGDMIVKDDRRTQFNFSAIAKGYGCDAVGAMLKRNGVDDYLVEIGGEIAAAGKNPSGKDWRISVDRPVYSDNGPIHESQAIIEFTDMGIATSGNYRNYHTEGGRRYGHTVLPFTGRPVQTDVISATVIASTCMEADGLATACMAMGSENVRIMNDSLNLPIMLVLADSTVWCSPRFNAMLPVAE